MKISFIPSSEKVELLVAPPVPAKAVIPDWYKKIPSFFNEKPNFEKNEIINKNLKMCMPFFDAISCGYIQQTWTDIFIEIKNNELYYHPADDQIEIMSFRKNTSLPIGDTFYPIEFMWKEPWIPRLPKGYSMLYVSPFNRLDLPIVSLSAIIDSDNYYHTVFGNNPFYIKNGFSGLIPKGTPMYQMLPIKIEKWNHKIIKYSENTQKKRQFEITSKFYGVYKEKFWKKKEYS